MARLLVAALLVSSLGLGGWSVAAATPPKGRHIGIPTVPYSTAKGSKSFGLRAVKGIVVDSRYETAVDIRGSTLIPPTLKQFAATFAEDLNATLGIQVPVTIGTSNDQPPDTIFLTIGKANDYVDAAKRPTSEGYSLSVKPTGITITGASPLGVWWGTRTIIQQAILGKDGLVPLAETLDSPGWGTRGMMLDAGRHFYPKEFIKELCAYMSFFKQNTFHLHLSDNLIVSSRYTRQETLELYARLRLYSEAKELDGLNRFRNESYTRQEFDDIQRSCAARGVTILPEIESPGHSLVITQWKPQIAFSGDFSLLNISHPDTMPAVKAIWAEFLDWFHTKTVSIGADEYQGPAGDYNKFVNEMDAFITNKSNKTKALRIWGTFPPKPEYENITKNVSIQHWAYFEDDPYVDYIQHNYYVVNSMDDFYIVNKYGGYPSTVDLSRIFKGSPGGGFWRPNIFHRAEAKRNPNATNPFVVGAITPLWNDLGPNSTVYTEAYYAWRKLIPAMADKQWGGELTEVDFERAFAALHPFIPAQNLDRAIPSKTPTIFNYTTFLVDTSGTKGHRSLDDSSANGYDASTNCPATKDLALEISPNCSVVTPLSTKGRNYTLTLSLMLTELKDQTNATLLTGGDSTLMLTPSLTLFASGNHFRLSKAAVVPLNTWTNVTISAVGIRTFATITPAGGKAFKEEFQTMLGLNGNGYHFSEMAIEAPLKQIGGANCGWSGQLRSFSLTT